MLALVSGLIIPAFAIANTDSALETAFQKEFAFLDQQRKALESQTNSFLNENRKEEAKLQKRLDRLKDKLIGLEIDVENKQATLEESTRSIKA